MNKLVSKNPILRFKLGRKIVKAQNGIGRWFYNGKEVFSDDGGRTFKLNNSGTLVGSPNAIKNLVKADKVGRTGYKVGDTWYLIGTGKKATSFISSTLPKKEYIPLGQVSATREKYSGNNSTKVTSSKPALIDNIFINGYLTNDDITLAGGVRAMQLKLKDAGFDIGKFGVDGKWGKDTEAAYLKYLLDQSNKKVLDSLSSTTPLTNFSNPIIENPSNINILVPKQTYNRTQIREFLRNKGVNPYQFNGAQRKALRMILNGQGTDDDKALVLSMGIFKQGGNLLPSRNIIERFRVTKALKGLKTALKAEDRYKNSSKDSVAYLGVPGKDKSYFGESIKRVTTPGKAAIQQLVLFRHYPHDNDTIYTEVPEHSKYSVFPFVTTNVQPRLAFNYAKTPDYEILKRRFNTAWNLAK